jgi:hypothetical protein
LTTGFFGFAPAPRDNLEARYEFFFLLELALDPNAAILVDLRGFCSGIFFARERVTLLFIAGLSKLTRNIKQ